MQIGYSRKFAKQYKIAPLTIKRLFDERVRIFSKDKFNPILNNHELSGKMKGSRSINLGGDWRALFDELPNGNVIFEAIGTHSQLYK